MEKRGMKFKKFELTARGQNGYRLNKSSIRYCWMMTPMPPMSPAGIAVMMEPMEFMHTVVNNILTPQRS